MGGHPTGCSGPHLVPQPGLQGPRVGEVRQVRVGSSPAPEEPVDRLESLGPVAEALVGEGSEVKALRVGGAPPQSAGCGAERFHRSHRFLVAPAFPCDVREHPESRGALLGRGVSRQLLEDERRPVPVAPSPRDRGLVQLAMGSGPQVGRCRLGALEVPEEREDHGNPRPLLGVGDARGERARLAEDGCRVAVADEELEPQGLTVKCLAVFLDGEGLCDGQRLASPPLVGDGRRQRGDGPDPLETRRRGRGEGADQRFRLRVPLGEDQGLRQGFTREGGLGQLVGAAGRVHGIIDASVQHRWAIDSALYEDPLGDLATQAWARCVNSSLRPRKARLSVRCMRAQSQLGSSATARSK